MPWSDQKLNVVRKIVVCRQTPWTARRQTLAGASYGLTSLSIYFERNIPDSTVHRTFIWVQTAKLRSFSWSINIRSNYQMIFVALDAVSYSKTCRKQSIYNVVLDIQSILTRSNFPTKFSRFLDFRHCFKLKKWNASLISPWTCTKTEWKEWRFF